MINWKMKKATLNGNSIRMGKKNIALRSFAVSSESTALGFYFVTDILS